MIALIQSVDCIISICDCINSICWLHHFIIEVHQFIIEIQSDLATAILFREKSDIIISENWTVWRRKHTVDKTVLHVVLCNSAYMGAFNFFFLNFGSKILNRKNLEFDPKNHNFFVGLASPISGICARRWSLTEWINPPALLLPFGAAHGSSTCR